MENNDCLPFSCPKCGCNKATWKTKSAKLTTIIITFCKLELPQMQVKYTECSCRYYITRMLLGIDTRSQISSKTKQALALIGSLCPFRVASKIVGLTAGFSINKNIIHKCVQIVGAGIDFSVDLDESSEFEADGTGISINGIKKRGQELKVMIQKKIGGGVRIVGLALGSYHSKADWTKLFSSIMDDLKCMKNPILTTDGDTAILKGLNGLSIIIQRCLWHIPHQAKYTMWQDKIKNKSDDWYKIMSKLYNIVAVSYNGENKDVIEKIVLEKKLLLEELLEFCLKNEYMKTYTYLSNAQGDMFNGILNKYNCKSQSLVERVMKTVNSRVNVGKWGTKGALNAVKIRLAHYYNNFNVEFKTKDNFKILLK